MNCSWCEERFERLLDGTLAPEEQSGLRAHVDACRDCGSLLEELRVVDALLLTPRTVALGPEFTRATMADVGTLAPPVRPQPPIAAYLVSYLVAAWSLVGTTALLSPALVRTAGAASVESARTVLDALGGIGHALGHVADRGEVGSWTMAGTVVAGNLLLVGFCATAVWLARPAMLQRRRG